MYLKKCIKERMSSYLANTENMYEEVKQKKKMTSRKFSAQNSHRKQLY